MRLVKFFKCLEYDFQELESQINDWIKAEKINVVCLNVQLTPQSLGSDDRLGEPGLQSDLLCVVLYEAE